MIKQKNNNSAIIWLCLAHLVNDIYTGALNPLLPFIATKLGFTLGLATVLVGITQICSNLFQPIFGFFADNILKRFFIFWGLILSSLFIPFAPSAPNVFLLTLFMVLGSLGSSFFHPQAIGFINSFSKLNCSRNMGIFVGMGSLGFALGPLLTAYIAQTLGLEKICITGFFGITIALFMFLFVPKLSCSTEKIEKKEFLKSFKEIFSNSQINYLMIISMMKSLVTNSSCILLPFLWQSLGYSPFYIGLALFLFIFAGAIGSLISPYIEKALSSKIIILVSMWLPFPLMLAFSLVYKTQPTFSLILFALIGFITMLAQPVTLVLAQKTLPKYKSIVAGLINGFCWGTVALCLSFLGVLAQKYGIMDVLVILTFLPISASWIVLKLREN